jgi:hypothetical protein
MRADSAVKGARSAPLTAASGGATTAVETVVAPQATGAARDLAEVPESAEAPELVAALRAAEQRPPAAQPRAVLRWEEVPRRAVARRPVAANSRRSSALGPSQLERAQSATPRLQVLCHMDSELA